jgi:hypothetical protein
MGDGFIFVGHRLRRDMALEMGDYGHPEISDLSISILYAR